MIFCTTKHLNMNGKKRVGTQRAENMNLNVSNLEWFISILFCVFSLATYFRTINGGRAAVALAHMLVSQFPRKYGEFPYADDTRQIEINAKHTHIRMSMLSDVPVDAFRATHNNSDEYSNSKREKHMRDRFVSIRNCCSRPSDGKSFDEHLVPSTGQK